MLGSSSQVQIRVGRSSDASALANVFRESWQLAYRGIIPHLHLESLIRGRSPDWWQGALKSSDSILVLEVAGEIAGYANWGVARSRGRHRGEIYELYLAPVYQGLGFGEHLFEGCRHAMDERRLKGLICWALADNAPAVEFYWRRGGRPIAKAVDKIGSAKLEKICFLWN